MDQQEQTRDALREMLAYLEARHAQVTQSFSLIFSRLGNYLTLVGAFFAVTVVVAPELVKMKSSLECRWIYAGLLCGFGWLLVCYARVLLLVHQLMTVKIDLPLVETTVFQTISRLDVIDEVKVLRELIRNCARAYEKNKELIRERNKPGETFKWWVYLMIYSFIVVMGAFVLTRIFLVQQG
jgi:hypothetical protein